MYDNFLKEKHPKKYTKFANFCPECTLFRNPQQVREQRSLCAVRGNTERETEIQIEREKTNDARPWVLYPSADR